MTQTGTVNGAEALLELFRTEGADHIFCSPIAAWAPLWEALARRHATTNVETPRYLNCRHEILAIGLAAGYYKATRPGAGSSVIEPTPDYAAMAPAFGAHGAIERAIAAIEQGRLALLDVRLGP